MKQIFKFNKLPLKSRIGSIMFKHQSWYNSQRWFPRQRQNFFVKLYVVILKFFHICLYTP